MESEQTTTPAAVAAMLQRVPLFRSVQPEHLAQLAQRTQPRSFAAGTVILREEETDLNLFVIRRGAVTVTRTDSDGAAVSLATLGAGDFFGEMGLLDGGPRSATVTALEDLDCLSLDSASLLEAVQVAPDIAMAMLAVLLRRIRTMSQQAVD